MLHKTLTKVFGNRNQRLLKKLSKSVIRINTLEPEMQQLSDQQLAEKTQQFRDYLGGQAAKIDEILEESFAVVREASLRTLGLRHFDVQLIGGMVLHAGKISEMRTGEGKTLMATLPAYLNALVGPVHIITVNDYLAQRDADWMGKVYAFLGLSVGVILSGQDQDQKRQAYQCDIVYGTNNEYGFDYLRDNMAFSQEQRFQQGLGFAVVDEVDSILIDEARTPLIISGPAEESTDLYLQINKMVPFLSKQEHEDGVGDFSVDEKDKQITLTEEGHEHAERLLAEADLLQPDGSLYDVGNISLLHHLYAGLRAHHLFQLDVDYIVQNNEVIIIDEFTGRMMTGRRWSEGLHQAIEAKEGVVVQQENQTLASITFQNYFRLYDKLSGMTGTADTEAPEFLQIYGLEVVIIPTNQEMIRKDYTDMVYRTTVEKFAAINASIQLCREKQQPVLVGTASIETSEYLSNLLNNAKVPHQILNAKHHEREATIIAEAGRPGAITIATNMAGRGTDIVLGGNLELELEGVDNAAVRAKAKDAWQIRHDQVIAAGGLHVLGTERNESRRVDNQLRGRGGRQGDPGSSCFYLSLEDTLLRVFGSERISGLMQRLGMEQGEAIEHPWVTKAIENAQKKVEGHNFDMRKQLLEYDDVANEQRKVTYQQRNTLMDSDDISSYVAATRNDVVTAVLDRYIPPQSLEEQWNISDLESNLKKEFGIQFEVAEMFNVDSNLDEDKLKFKIQEGVEKLMMDKEEQVGAEAMRHVEKSIMLRILDEHWKEHLAQMDYLRQGIGLRGYAQKNPKQEYKREAFDMFSEMLDNVKFEVISVLARFHISSEEELTKMEAESSQQEMEFIHNQAPTAESNTATTKQSNQNIEQPYVRQGRKIGRNESCPCGSGKKYKQCHGHLS